MRFEELTTTELYDAVLANASLLHVPRNSLLTILPLIRNALKIGGLHHATYKMSKGEGRDRLGRYFNHLSVRQLEQMHQSYGSRETLSVTEYRDGSYHFVGLMPWVAALARMVARTVPFTPVVRPHR